jgi:predicted RNA-binding Zn-ribbon protein involved in translation (DUF1610 family)
MANLNERDTSWAFACPACGATVRNPLWSDDGGDQKERCPSCGALRIEDQAILKCLDDQGLKTRLALLRARR